jgi:tetratricopeptide (TPR) repeat protein
LGVLPNVPIEESLAYLAKAVELAETNGLLEIASRANHNLGVMTAEYSGDQKASRVHYARAAEIAKQRGAGQEEIFSLIQAAGVSLVMGELKTAQEIVNRIKQIKSTLTDPGQAEFEFAGIEFGMKFLGGEFQEALEIVRRVRVEARERGDLQMLHNYCTNQADVFLVLDYVEGVDDWSEAEQAAKEGIEVSSRGVSTSIQAHSLLAIIYLRQGRLDEARQLYSESKQIAGDSPTFWQKQALQNIERDLARAECNWGAALKAAETASKRLVQTGMRWFWSFSLVEWAETHLARGEALDYERARTLFREALAVFEEMGAAFFINVIEGRLHELRAKTIAVTVAHDEVTQELAQAGKIQGSFLPEEIPVLPGWEISAILQPARETSGDFYDFIHLPGNKLGLVVADVADKGIGAALYMTTCRTLIRTYAGEHPHEPELVLAKANRRILADTHGGLFITVFYAVLDATSGEIKYCNAGHNPPFVFSPGQDGTHLELSRTGMPLGILPEEAWEQGIVSLDAGSLLVGYTDGITENHNEDMEFFGKERLAAVVEVNLNQPAKMLLESVLETVQDFSGSRPPGDDKTLLVVKRGE